MEKQIILKARGSIMTVPGFGDITDGVSFEVRDAIVNQYPELKDKFEEVTIVNESKRVETKK